jgi:2-polyprenyl-3-methyl-5-hydroxy-6-metoxy-1,4-benzoquinol methylase
MTHPAMGDDAVDRLRSAQPSVGESEAGAPSLPPPPPAREPAVPTGLRGQVKRTIRKAIAWYVDEKAQDTADAAADRAADRVLIELGARLDEHERRLESGDAGEVRALTINLELLKGELRGLQRVLDDLGDAIAPAAGIDGARDRMGELRDRVHALERRTRGATAGLANAEVGPGGASPSAAPAFDYLGFERRFRGDPALVVAEESDRYLDLLRRHAPVLDVGCGRGELVELLAAEGVQASGVDLDAEMAADAAARGVNVVHGDAIEHLRALPPESLGSVVSLHVIEHLELGSLLELLELSASRLKPGGVFVAETPNPASLIVLGNSYVLDPTHVRPLHPSLMVFLCEGAGFRDVKLRFFSPAEDYQLPLVDDPEAPAWVASVNTALSKLNETLFGPQEYAVIATVA